jgi:hypothetical protein
MHMKQKHQNATVQLFLKSYICKHVVSTAIRLKYCKLPPAVKAVSLDENGKAVDQQKAKTAFASTMINFHFSCISLSYFSYI